MSFKIVQGNLLESHAKYICHQCNCVSQKSAHLAKSVFSAFPYANVYKERTFPHIPSEKNNNTLGNIIVRGDGQDQRFVINMLAQYYPGSPKFPHSNKDGYKVREAAFQQCLIKISQISDPESISFPWMIGCGAAGGNWDVYLPMIDQFAKTIDADITIVRLVD
jgi:hypothetical protein